MRPTRVCWILWIASFLIPAGRDGGEIHAQDARGKIQGKVTLPAQVQVAPRARASRYGTAGRVAASRPAVDEKADVVNVVVYLEGPGLEPSEGRKNVVLDQQNQMFIPHVLPIVKGTEVRVVNRDKTYHNVFSLSKVKKFNIGRRPTGEEVPVTFDNTGEVQVFCDIHSNMAAFILVFDNSYFAQPNEEGSFVISGIPPGQYTLNAWHERFTAPARKVTVRQGESVTINIDFQ